MEGGHAMSGKENSRWEKEKRQVGKKGCCFVFLDFVIFFPVLIDNFCKRILGV
jgi:hypothetical protein